MSFKLERHSNKMSLLLNVTQFGMSLKLKCYSNWNITQIGTSLKLKYHSNLNVTWIVTKILISLKSEDSIDQKVVNSKISNSASKGRISILLYIKKKNM